MNSGSSAVLDEMTRTAAFIPFEKSDALAERILAAPRTYIHGVGRCGLIMRTFAMRLAQMSLPVQVVGETVTTAAQAGDLLVVGSGTGETGGAVGIARSAREIGLHVTALTAAPLSVLVTPADEVIALPGVAKLDADAAVRSIQPPGSLFEQMLFCFLEQTIVTVAMRRDPEYAEVRRRHANLE